MNTRTKYIITEVLDNDTQKRSESFGYRVGRECFLTFFAIDSCMIVEYLNGSSFITSKVQKLDKTNDSYTVETLNRTYKFNKAVC